jgi:hypothetical protein
MKNLKYISLALIFLCPILLAAASSGTNLLNLRVVPVNELTLSTPNISLTSSTAIAGSDVTSSIDSINFNLTTNASLSTRALTVGVSPALLPNTTLTITVSPLGTAIIKNGGNAPILTPVNLSNNQSTGTLMNSLSKIIIATGKINYDYKASVLAGPTVNQTITITYTLS